jgi:hypothetical protein
MKNMKTHPKHHTVHAFAVVRVRVPDIMARSHAEAIADAEERLDYAGLFNDDRAGTEWAEEVSHYLVDEAHDPEHACSCFYAPDGRTPLVDGQVPVRLVIEMNGGRIQELQAERPGVQVLIIDHATADITGPTILNDPAGRPTYQSLETAEVAPAAVAGWYQNYHRQQPLDRNAALDAVRMLIAEADDADSLLTDLVGILRRCTDLPDAA